MLRKKYDLALDLFIGLIFFIAILVVAFLTLASCDESDDCKTEEVRCNKTVLEICNADTYWEEVMDCAAFEPGRGELVCCDVGGEAMCSLSAECDAAKN